MLSNKQYQDLRRRLLVQDLVHAGYQKLDFSTAGAKALTVPSRAVYAEIRIESSVTTGIVGRYLNAGATTPPTSTDAMAVAHLDFFDITGADLISQFRLIQTVAGTHTAHVQYFKKA